MNIFVTDNCPYISAKNLDDKRVVKMVLETAQLLSSAIILNGGKAPYKLTHKGHPCTIFTAKTKGNYRWVLNHFKGLCQEYTRRYGKTHKSESLMQDLEEGIRFIPDGDLTDFANCSANLSLNISYKHLTDVTLAYKLYLADRWENDKREPTWR
jgi:hypothetical protein